MRNMTLKTVTLSAILIAAMFVSAAAYTLSPGFIAATEEKELASPIGAAYTFGADDFTAAESTIVFLELPSHSLGTLTLDKAEVLPFETVAVKDLTRLTFTPAKDAAGEALFVYRSGDSICAIRLYLTSTPDNAPTAGDLSVTTMQNISYYGKLSGSDDGPLSFTLEQGPRFGEVAVYEDGSFVYSPNENKTGADSFSFTAADEAGNRSNEAVCTVKVVKNSSDVNYVDIKETFAEYPAARLASYGIILGGQYDGERYFDPDSEIDRATLSVMTAKITTGEDYSTDGSTADAAVKTGLLSGYENGDLAPEKGVTRGEAAKIICTSLGLEPVAAGDFSDELPAWAEGYAGALKQVGVVFGYSDGSFRADNALTAAEAAAMLARAADFSASKADGGLFR